MCMQNSKNSMMNSKMNSPQFAAGVAPRVLGYVLSRMRLAVESKETGRYDRMSQHLYAVGGSDLERRES